MFALLGIRAGVGIQILISVIARSRTHCDSSSRDEKRFQRVDALAASWRDFDISVRLDEPSLFPTGTR
jgi:hypothetical protein